MRIAVARDCTALADNRGAEGNVDLWLQMQLITRFAANGAEVSASLRD